MRRGVLVAGVALIAFGLVMSAFYLLNSELNHETGVKRIYPRGEDGIILSDLESGDVIYLDFETELNVNVWVSPTADHLLDGEPMATNSSGGTYSYKVDQAGSWYVTFQNLDHDNDTMVEYDIRVQNFFGRITLILGPVFVIFGVVVVVAGFRLEKEEKIKPVSTEGPAKASKGKKVKAGMVSDASALKGKPAKRRSGPSKKRKTRTARPTGTTVFEPRMDTFEPEPEEDMPAWDALDRSDRDRRPAKEADRPPSAAPLPGAEPTSDGFSDWAEEDKPEEPEEEEEEEKSLPCVMCGGRMFRDASSEWVCDRCGNRI